MTRRFTGRTGRRTARSFRPATDWLSVRVEGLLTAPGQTFDVFDLSLAATADLDNDPETVRRIRGSIEVVLDELLVPQSTFVGVGIGVATPEAIAQFAAGALPLPLSTAHWDGWMWIDCYHYQQISAAGSTTLMFRPQGIIDSRAQRRLEDDHLFLALQLASTAGVEINVQYGVFLRWLQSESSR